MATVPRASLLGIPPELRLQIYDSLFDEDVDYNVIKRWTGSFQEGSFSTSPMRNPEARLTLPWLSAMLSCRTIAHEMQSLMRDHKEGDSKYTTYVMAAELGNGGDDVRDVTWRRLPCAPSDAEVLIIECGAESDDFEPWGDGGPRNIVRSMYQTLNLFLHCGPRLDPTKPLPSGHVHLRELVVNVRMRGEIRQYFSMSGEPVKFSRSAYTLIRDMILRPLCYTGLLVGYVDRAVISDGKEESEMPLKAERGGVPEHWHRYGFEWGVGDVGVAR
ncbi:hypothetical protein LTR02_005968 [Friedmanniomyces endolithicus]|nr:hypothetical protein LTR94_000844 [Friedmanniomyces endolithicus]KAK0808326.1 hypothetical protein LTR59_002928 [Friedmanniomyces endolithicus]KAK0817767.1 hypothetical protein LTR38_001388 [Friedmanniomyces endolithicus]KAK0853771.1 hypothetical protein LTR03_002733 [Friedmanniomyces endolithicus]KAK0870717.1 hypothetical protein LTS02_002223 [Friedmanniomyces endolithicus]